MNIQTRVLCARDCRSADPRAVEVAVLDQRDSRRALFIPARRSVRPMADASCRKITLLKCESTANLTSTVNPPPACKSGFEPSGRGTDCANISGLLVRLFLLTLALMTVARRSLISYSVSSTIRVIRFILRRSNLLPSAFYRSSHPGGFTSLALEDRVSKSCSCSCRR